jgi:hypothetical protein
LGLLPETARAAGAREASAKALANKAVTILFFITHLLSFFSKNKQPTISSVRR